MAPADTIYDSLFLAVARALHPVPKLYGSGLDEDGGVASAPYRRSGQRREVW